MRRWLLAAMLVGVATAAEAQPLQTSSVTFLNAVTTTGTGTALNTGQMSVVAVQITPGSQDTWRIRFEATLDNTTWSTVACYPTGSSTAATSVTTTTTSGNVDVNSMYRCNVAGYSRFRINLMSITAKSGTGLTVKGIGFQNPFSLGGVTY